MTGTEDTTPTDPTADEREQEAWAEYMREHGYATYPVAPDTGADFSAGFQAGVSAERERMGLAIEEAVNVGPIEGVSFAGRIADALSAAGFGDVSAWRERAEQAERDLAEALNAGREIVTERDALRARIEAVLALHPKIGAPDGMGFWCDTCRKWGADGFGVWPCATVSALAGDQPAPEPTLSFEAKPSCSCMSSFDGEGDGRCEVHSERRLRQGDAEPAGDSTPEPPLRVVSDAERRSIEAMKFREGLPSAFDWPQS